MHRRKHLAIKRKQLTTTQKGVTVTVSLHVRKAYHEAGHAVFAEEYGILQDEGLHLAPPEGALAGAGGGVKIAWSSVSHENRDAVQQDLDVLLAATIAEIVLLENSPHRPNASDMLNLHISAAHDIWSAIGKLTHVVQGKNEYEALRDGLAVVASKVVARWPAIEAVAKAALKKGSLSRDEIRSLISSAGQS